MSAYAPQGLLPRTGGPGSTSTAGVAGANVAGPFLTATLAPGLPKSRPVVAGTRLTIADGGPQHAFTIAVNTATDALLTAVAAASIATTTAQAGLAGSRLLTAGTGITLTDGGAQGPLTIAATPFSPNFSIYQTTFTLSPVPGSVGNTPTSLTANITLSQVGLNITITVGPAAFNGGSLGITSITGNIPSAFAPAQNVVGSMPLLGGGVPIMGGMVLGPGGAFLMHYTTSGVWPAGSSSWPPFTFVYQP